jgi:hypothetical protein
VLGQVFNVWGRPHKGRMKVERDSRRSDG